MRPRTQLLVLAGFLATAVILLACLPAQEGVEPATTPAPGTGTPAPEATSGIPPTPAPLTPTPAAEAGRPDCPQDWAAYNDPDGYFSICYPRDWEAKSGPAQGYFGRTFDVRSPDVDTDAVFLIVHWTEFAIKGCEAVDAIWQEVKAVTLTLAAKSVSACVGDVVDIE